MIHNYPFFGFPNYLNHTQNDYYTKNNMAQTRPYLNNYYNNIKNFNPNNSVMSSHRNKTNLTQSDTQSRTSSKNNTESPFLNLFGISLSFDDILLICVILFLFFENTDDYYLLLALILLLLG